VTQNDDVNDVLHRCAVIGRRAKVVSCRVGAKPHYSDKTRLVADLSTWQTISTSQDGQLPRDFTAGTWSRPTKSATSP